MLVDHLLKTKKELRNLTKQDIHAIFTKMGLIRHVFNMTWFMEVLAKRTAYDKVLRDKEFNIAKNPKYDRYQREIPSMVQSSGSRANMKAMPDKQITEELQKPIIRKVKKRTVYSSFKYNIWSADSRYIDFKKRS